MSLPTTDVGAGQQTLVLLHAFPVNRQLWDGVADRLARSGMRVIAPDLPGFGEAALASGEPDLRAMASAVFATLAELQVRDYVLGGLSMGGYVAMQMLRQGDEVVPLPAKLALVDTKMGADPAAARDNRLAVADRVLAEQSTEFLVDAMLPVLLSEVTRSDRPHVVETVSSWIRATSPQAVAWAQRAMARRPDSRELLAGYAGPALVLAGSDDTISPPEEQREIAATLQHAELHLVPSVGHLSAVEDPAAVAEALHQFCRS